MDAILSKDSGSIVIPDPFQTHYKILLTTYSNTLIVFIERKISFSFFTPESLSLKKDDNRKNKVSLSKGKENEDAFYFKVYTA
jgi:hypothetical protein